MAAVEAAAATHGLWVMHRKMVSEAALPGVDKGAALHGFLAQPPFAGRVPVMIGDDATDEDGFRAVQALGGFGIKIGPARRRRCIALARRRILPIGSTQASGEHAEPSPFGTMTQDVCLLSRTGPPSGHGGR
ncbi:hypothetical protein ATO3_24695 [Marinibacterium profundimaris]|uniref:Trehalose-phosphatase n=1 Tax=Marinibacterium profundimaris TaxID=1679460 RepID=A0A225NDG3_9RHOB|nr:hypothetical protein ATO3_24695 [Marinibacterium profundimaris]